jgi:precorrin-6B methylase 2
MLRNVGTEIVMDGVANYEAVLELSHADLDAAGVIVVNVVLSDYNLPRCDWIIF